VESVRDYLYNAPHDSQSGAAQMMFSSSLSSTSASSIAAKRSPRYFTLKEDEDKREMFMPLGNDDNPDTVTSREKYNSELQVHSMKRIIMERQLETLSDTSSHISNTDDLLTSRTRFSNTDDHFLSDRDDSMVSEKLEDDVLTDSFAYSDDESQAQSMLLSPPSSTQKPANDRGTPPANPPQYPLREDFENLEDNNPNDRPSTPMSRKKLLSTPKGAISPYRRLGAQGSPSSLRKPNTSTPSQLTTPQRTVEQSDQFFENSKTEISPPNTKHDSSTTLHSSPRTLTKYDLALTPSPKHPSTSKSTKNSPARGRTPTNSSAKKVPLSSRKSSTPLRRAYSPPKTPHVSQSKPRIPPQRKTPAAASSPRRKPLSSPTSGNKRQPSPIQRPSPKSTASPPRVPSLRFPKYKQNTSISISTPLDSDVHSYDDSAQSPGRNGLAPSPRPENTTPRSPDSSRVAPAVSASPKVNMSVEMATSPLETPRTRTLQAESSIQTPRSARLDRGTQSEQQQSIAIHHPNRAPVSMSEIALQTVEMTDHIQVRHEPEANEMSAQTVFYTDDVASQTPLPPQNVDSESQTMRTKKRHFMVQMRGEAFQRHTPSQTDDKSIAHQTAQTVRRRVEECEIQTDPVPENVKVVIQRPEIETETQSTQSEGSFVQQAQYNSLAHELYLTNELVQDLKDTEQLMRDRASKQLAKKDQQLELQQTRIDMLLKERQNFMDGEESSKMDAENLTKQVQQCRATIKQQQSIIAEMTKSHSEEVENLKKQNADIRATFQHSQDREKEMHEEERNVLSQKLSTAISKLHDAQRMLQDREDELFKLKHDQQLNDRKLSRHERTVKQYEEDISKLKQEVQEQYISIRQLDDNILSRDEQIQRLKDAQIKSQEKMDDLSSVIRELRARLSSNEYDTQMYNNLKTSHEQMRKDYDKKIEQLKTIISQLHTKIQNQSNDFQEELLSQKQAFEKQLKTLQQEHAREMEQWELEAGSHLKSKRDALFKQLQDEQTKTCNQQELIRNLKETLRRQKDNGQKQQEKIELLESTLQSMQEKLKEVLAQRHDSRSQVEQWKNTTHNRLQSLKDEYQRNTDHYKQQLALKEEELAKMKKKFSRVLSHMDTVIDKNTGAKSSNHRT